MAVDISPKNVELARLLFGMDRVSFHSADIVEDDLGEGSFEVLVLADVYEHIPKDKRCRLHERLSTLLAPDGKVIITVPTPAAQKDEQQRGIELQIVDEAVTLPDLLQFAEDIDADLTYYAVVSVWKTNDYAHAVLERDATGVRAFRPRDHLGIRRAAPATIGQRLRNIMDRKIGKQLRRLFVATRLRHLRSSEGCHD